MTITYPNDAGLNGQEADAFAREIVSATGVIRRLVRELTSDAAVDLEKLAKLKAHGLMYLDLTASPSALLIGAVEAVFRGKGVVWATRQDMNADLQSLRTEVTALRSWLIANLPEVNSPVTVTYPDDSYFRVDTPITVAKPHAVEAEVAKVASVFG